MLVQCPIILNHASSQKSPKNYASIICQALLETIARQILPAHLSSPSKSLSDVINSISSDANVQWYWTLASKSINSPEDAEWLLKEIVKLFVTVRGFSIAANWMELYKTEEKKTSKKSTGLRKQLS